MSVDCACKKETSSCAIRHPNHARFPHEGRADSQPDEETPERRHPVRDRAAPACRRRHQDRDVPRAEQAGGAGGAACPGAAPAGGARPAARGSPGRARRPPHLRGHGLVREQPVSVPPALVRRVPPEVLPVADRRRTRPARLRFPAAADRLRPLRAAPAGRLRRALRQRGVDSASGQWQDTSVCFAAFVNEDHPWINALLQEAMSGGGARSFTGYQSGAPGAMTQAQAVWDALAARGLSYVNVATDSGTSPLVSTQYVRFLDQSVHDQGANCVDASVLFASILRRIGLRPVLLFRPGHCFTGFYDTAEGSHLVAFETTMLGSAPFGAAAAEGSKEL